MSDDDECPALVPGKVPVIILTGFLGSGKTTLLQYILGQPHGLKIAVVVNEFDFGKAIEKGLTVKSSQVADDDWVELNNGCLCCTSKSQSVVALEQLIARKGSLDFILVETAGMADPAPIAAMFWQDEALQSCLSLAGIVTLIDCRYIRDYLKPEGGYHEATQQILVADRLVFNKTDLVSSSELEEVVKQVASINPSADHEFSSFSKIQNLDFLTKLSATDADADAYVTAKRAVVDAVAVEHRHESRVGAYHVVVTGAAQSKAAVERQFAALLQRDDDDDATAASASPQPRPLVVRAKAAVWIAAEDGVGTPNLWQLQSIGEYLDVVRMASSEGIARYENRFLVLGRDLDVAAVTAHLQAAFAPVCE